MSSMQLLKRGSPIRASAVFRKYHDDETQAHFFRYCKNAKLKVIPLKTKSLTSHDSAFFTILLINDSDLSLQEFSYAGEKPPIF